MKVMDFLETTETCNLKAVESDKFEPRQEETNVLVSDLVRHKPGYAVTEDG